MNERTREKLESYLKEAETFERDVDLERWATRIEIFLDAAIGQDAGEEFRSLVAVGDDPWDTFAMQRGHLEGLLAKGDDGSSDSATSKSVIRAFARQEPPKNPNSRRVFVVHGHDGESKEAVARFLEKLGLSAIILHEQPNQGRTIIEKFEVSSDDVAFAVVLLTPDDVGGLNNSNPADIRPRARQNVILELGYFMGRLGRKRVCALHKGNIELPSDYQGIVYIPLDGHGAWRTKLAQEFVQAKLVIKVEALLET